MQLKRSCRYEKQTHCAAGVMTNNNRLQNEKWGHSTRGHCTNRGDLVFHSPKKRCGKQRANYAVFWRSFLWMINGARMLPNMPAAKNRRDTRGHNKGVPVGRWASCWAPNSLTYHWGRLSCKRFPHRWNWWRSRVCSAAACGDARPCKMHCRQLKKAEEESIYSTWQKINAVLNKISE